MIWNIGTHGQFSMRSAYYVSRILLEREETRVELRVPAWKIMWSANVLPKTMFFIWRLAWNILPTVNNLRMRGVHVERICCVCGLEEEPIGHTFFECVFALKIWERVCEWVTPAIEEWRYEEDCWEKLIMKSAQDGMVELFCIILWLCGIIEISVFITSIVICQRY